MTKIAILGTGPSGLVALQAARMYYGSALLVHAFSPLEKSPVWGAQYLHQPIPGISTDDPKVIRYKMEGRPEEYLKKVYADKWDGHISDDLRDQAHMAWDLRAAYETMWSMFDPFMHKFQLGASIEQNRIDLDYLSQNFDMVVNTIPRPALCLKPRQHEFRHTEIWAMGDSDIQKVPMPTTEGVITYNGTENVTWYRASRINGYSTAEWPQHINRPPIPGITRVRKPINHTCDCLPEIKHLGRMGRWDKNVLLHDVYADMTEQIMLHEEGK